MSRTGHLLVGEAEHGVVRFGTDLVGALMHRHAVGPVVRTSWPELRADAAAVLAPLQGCPLVHTQYTDRLFGARCEDSAELVEWIAAALATRGSWLSVTLHDLPGTAAETPAADEALRRRRYVVYRRIAAACTGVVVCSRHERRRLEALADELRRVEVIPLPVQPPGPPPEEIRPARDVTVLGFLYPGKGHDEVLRAMAGLPSSYGLTVLGRPSDGHDDLVGTLQTVAAAAGRCLHVTGFVPDAELPEALHRAGVPVAPHRQVSASGSIATWLGAGRRPLVPDVPYTRELTERYPGALWRYGDEGSLSTALREAVAEPERTWLGGDRVGPSPAEVAAAYDGVLTAWS
ncbi:MAG: hypothetical protein M3513_15900 [Actinomycetota bacterium]|nr:hypothetical protein [Actinomycetota bacterium]